MCCLQFSWKTNKNYSTWGTIVVKSKHGSIEDTKKTFWNYLTFNVYYKKYLWKSNSLEQEQVSFSSTNKMVFKTVGFRNSFQCLLLFPTILYVESWVRIDNNAIQMKLPNRTDSNIFECKSSLFLSASTEVKKCTTWTVKFVVNELLPTHLHHGEI